MEYLQVLGFFRPAQGGECPQGRGKPRVQHVLVLLQVKVRRQVVLRAHGVLAGADVKLAIGVVPGGNPVAPPQLPADTPGLDIAHPGEVGVLPLLRHELDVAVLDSLDGGLGHLPCVHVPLPGEKRFDDDAGPVAARHLERVILDFLEQSQCLEVDHDTLARREAVHAAVGFRRGVADGGVLGQDVDHGQAVAAAHFVVVEVVRRGDLHATGAEFPVHVLVGDYRYFPVGQWQQHGAADEVRVAFVLRVNRHRGIAEHGLGACRGHHEMALAAGQRVAEVPQVALSLLGNDFEIGYGRMQRRVPVHQPLAAVDQALPVQANENLLYGGAQPRVHGEAFPRPVEGGAQSAQLPRNRAAGLFLPFPDLLNELLATQFVAAAAAGLQLPFNHHLRGDAGVVGAHLPQGVAALHAVVADQGVHDRFLEAVPHVQAARHVGRGDHDAVGRFAATGREIATVFPGLVPAGLDSGRLECFFHNVANQ